MANQPDYAIALDNKFGYPTLIDVPQLVEANAEQWVQPNARAANKTVMLMMSAADVAPTCN